MSLSFSCHCQSHLLHLSSGSTGKTVHHGCRLSRGCVIPVYLPIKPITTLSSAAARTAGEAGDSSPRIQKKKKKCINRWQAALTQPLPWLHLGMWPTARPGWSCQRDSLGTRLWAIPGDPRRADPKPCTCRCRGLGWDEVRLRFLVFDGSFGGAFHGMDSISLPSKRLLDGLLV